MLPVTPISAMRLSSWQVLTVSRIRSILTLTAGVPTTLTFTTSATRKRQSSRVFPFLLRRLLTASRRITSTSQRAAYSPRSFSTTLSRQREGSADSLQLSPPLQSLISIIIFNLCIKSY